MNFALAIVAAVLAGNPGEAVVRCTQPGSAYSGSVVRSDTGEFYVLTAIHCVRNRPPRIEVRFQDGRIVYGSWHAMPPTTDGPALIKLPAGDYPHIDIAPRQVKARTEKVWALGYPSGTKTMNRMTGYVFPGGTLGPGGGSGFSMGGGGDTHTVRFNKGQIPGYSGGPLLNRQGQIVGLASCTDFRSTWHITHSTIAAFCYRYGIRPAVPHPQPSDDPPWETP